MFSKSRSLKDNKDYIISQHREINEYRTITNNKKRIINLRISEEEKNLEFSLLKIKKKYNNLSVSKNDNHNFSEKYPEFAKTHFKSIDSLVKDISEIYSYRGYRIPNLQNNLFKFNPLLEANSSKIYLSTLFNFNTKSKKFKNRRLFINSDKSLSYMKKLNKIISPEIDKKGKKIDGFISSPNKPEKKQLKIQQQTKNENRMLSSKINNLINLINTNGLNNLDDQSYIDTSNKSVHLRGKSKNFYNRKYSKNLINDVQVNRSGRKNSFCVRNHNDLFLNKKIYKKQTTINNYFIKKKNNAINLNNKTIQSTKKLDLSSNLNGIANTHFETNNKLNAYLNSNVNSNINSNLNSNLNSNSNIHETNSLYLNTDINSNKSIRYIINTPKLLENAYNSQDKYNTNTNAFSTTNENNTMTSKPKNDNAKSKISTLFKVKEFNLNSNNKFNQSSAKVSQCSSSNKINKIEKVEKKFPFEFRISTPKKLFKNNEEKKNFVNKIYKDFNAGEYKDAEKDIKIYLSEIKEVNHNDIKDMISRYTNQNIIVNFKRLKQLIDEKKITKKSFRLYLNNHDYTRIEPLLKSLKDKDNIIRQFDKKMVNAVVKKQKSN